MIRSLAVVLGLIACGGGSKPVPAGAQVGPALGAALAAADEMRAPWRCAASDGPSHPDETLTVGEHSWNIAGHTLQRDAKAKEIVIGAIADTGQAAAPTLAALGRLRTRLARADLVLALGGMGTTQAELEASLGALGDRAPFPILALPGDLESVGALAAAVKTLRGRGIHVIDGRLIHTIELPGVTIAAIAGAGAASRLVAGSDGCTYEDQDVATAITGLTGKRGIRIVASAEAPRTSRGGEPSGELALTATAGQEIDVALHGPTTEAASRARAGARHGDAVALTPGTADATPRLPGPVIAPTAGMLTVSGEAWTWKPIADAE
ncbi:MAG: hypothetical protein JWP01_3228 [Myxococcales bacterium]|nr:hypothetical protein [Myxococcales bacterium]